MYVPHLYIQMPGGRYFQGPSLQLIVAAAVGVASGIYIFQPYFRSVGSDHHHKEGTPTGHGVQLSDTASKNN